MPCRQPAQQPEPHTQAFPGLLRRQTALQRATVSLAALFTFIQSYKAAPQPAPAHDGTAAVSLCAAVSRPRRVDSDRPSLPLPSCRPARPNRGGHPPTRHRPPVVGGPVSSRHSAARTPPKPVAPPAQAVTRPPLPSQECSVHRGRGPSAATRANHAPKRRASHRGAGNRASHRGAGGALSPSWRRRRPVADA